MYGSTSNLFKSSPNNRDSITTSIAWLLYGPDIPQLPDQVSWLTVLQDY